MKGAKALREFFNKGPECNPELMYPAVSVTELREFKLACTDDEYREMAAQACELIGETFDG